MDTEEPVLSPAEARTYYDRFGRKQDWQGFYEDPALAVLIAYAGFGEAWRVFEFGCGTGKLAARLLAEQLPPTATYFGCDVSPTMVGLARERLAAYGDRAEVALSDGAVRFPPPDRSVDRVVSAYVLDLLSADDIRRAFAEAHRVLAPGGKLGVVSLTEGVTVPSRIVVALWKTLFRWRPSRVGGCRPIRYEPFVDGVRWRVEHRSVVTPFGVPSEVLVLTAR
jgi:ubiquinone/menaquinone biosynthesis C-methylase UbiE